MNLPSDQSRSGSVGMWAWFLPAAYVSHVAEEAFGGHGLMEWMAAGGGVRLSMAAFHWPQPCRCGHYVPGCMGGSEVEGLAMAFGKRGDDHFRQWSLRTLRYV